MRNATVRMATLALTTLVMAFVCLALGMWNSTFGSQGLRLSGEEMLVSHGAYAKVGKCTSTCDRYNNYDQTCVADGVANGTACNTCSVGGDIYYAGIAGTGCPSGTKGNKASNTNTQDCGTTIPGSCSGGVCVQGKTSNGVQCKDPVFVISQ